MREIILAFSNAQKSMKLRIELIAISAIAASFTATVATAQESGYLCFMHVPRVK
jgi:hypothetical protein